MNSLYENQGMEDYDSIRTRLADSICDECQYACYVHKAECSKSQKK